MTTPRALRYAASPSRATAGYGLARLDQCNTLSDMALRVEERIPASDATLCDPRVEPALQCGLRHRSLDARRFCNPLATAD